MQYLRKILESVIDPTQETLDPELFDIKGESFEIKPEAQSVLLEEADDFRQYGTIDKVMLVGSMLSKQWLPWTDIDLHILMTPDNETALDEAKELVAEKGEALLEGTRHPIQIYVETPETFNEDKYTGILDLNSGELIKGPYDISADVTKYMDDFREHIGEVDLSKAELVRDLIDFKLLQEFSAGDKSDLTAQIKAKIGEINEDVENLVNQYTEMREIRGQALSGEVTPEEIEKWGHEQLLPGNVKFKLMERYAYKSLLSELKRILSDDEAIDEPEEVEQVVKAIQQHAVIPVDEAITEDDEQHMAELEDVVMSDPDNFEAWIELGKLYAAKGWKMKAEEHFEQALEIDPDNAEADEALRSLYMKDVEAGQEEFAFESLVKKINDPKLNEIFGIGGGQEDAIKALQSIGQKGRDPTFGMSKRKALKILKNSGYSDKEIHDLLQGFGYSSAERLKYKDTDFRTRREKVTTRESTHFGKKLDRLLGEEE